MRVLRSLVPLALNAAASQSYATWRLARSGVAMKSYTLLGLMLMQQAIGQEITVHTVPEQVVPGSAFMVKVSGSFATPCSLDRLVDVALEPDELVLTVGSRSQACVQVLTSLTGAFGPFELDVTPGQEVSIVVRAEDQADELGSASVTVAEAGASSLKIRSGVYWDEAFAGNGIAMEVQGDRLFLGMMGYEADGSAQWQASVASISDGVAQGDLGIFADGACAPCGDQGSAAELVGSAGPFHIAFEDFGLAYLSFGNAPAKAMMLRPFALRLAESEGTIAGATFVMPDLGGRWLLTDLMSGQFHTIVELTQLFSGISDSGLAYFSNDDGSIEVQCSQRADVAFVCDFLTDGTLLFSAPATQIAHDMVVTNQFVAVKLN